MQRLDGDNLGNEENGVPGRCGLEAGHGAEAGTVEDNDKPGVTTFTKLS